MVDVEINDILAALETKSKCVICGCAPKPGQFWYRCEFSHHICMICTKIVGLTQCALCLDDDLNDSFDTIFGKLNAGRAKKLAVVTKNYIYERTEGELFRCRFALRGCQVAALSRKIINDHQKECDFGVAHALLGRIYEAARNPAIDWNEFDKIEYDTFDYLCDKGVIKRHYTRNEFRSEFCFTDNMKNHQNRLSLLRSSIELYDQLFIERIAIDETGEFYHWIQFVGPPEHAQNFYYAIEYHGLLGSQCHFEGLYHGPMLPINASIGDTMKNRQCLATNYENLQRFFLSKQGTFWYTVRIMQYDLSA